jgi:signal transduction histidine kinase
VRGPDGAITDFAIVDCNARAAALVRMPHEDLVGHHLCELFPEHRASGAFDRYVQVVASGETIEAEFGTRDPRYTAQWLRVQASALGDGLALSTRDISERKRLERRWRRSGPSSSRCSTTSATAWWPATRRGGSRCSTTRRARSTGSPSSRSRAVGRALLALPPRRRDAAAHRGDPALPRLLGRGGGQRGDRGGRRGAPPRTLLNSGRAFYDEGGAKLGAVVAMHDVTTRREAERFKDQLIGTVSHELRTRSPRSRARSTCSPWAGTTSASRAAAHGLAQHLAARAHGNDLLDVERISSGRGAALARGAAGGRDPLDACEASAPCSTAPGSPRARAERRRGGARGAAVSVWADADRLTQVVTNLVSNAVKFTPRGGTITVGATPAPAPAGEAEGAAARVHVRDTGRGIAADKLERIFNRFEQVDAADAKEKGARGSASRSAGRSCGSTGGASGPRAPGRRGERLLLHAPDGEAELTRQRP